MDASSSDIDAHQTELESLPNELLFYIISLACDTQMAYRSYLLINQHIHHLTKFRMLYFVPIILNERSIRSFSAMFKKNPEVAFYVRYLWSNSRRVDNFQIISACTNLVSLACISEAIYYLCSPPLDEGFRHKKLTELTLFSSMDWEYLRYLPYADELCRQITHLRLHNPSSPAFKFPRNSFPSLTHYSSAASTEPLGLVLLAPEITHISALPKLQHIVITTFFWEDRSVDRETRDVLALDKRLRIVFFGPVDDPAEWQLWCGRSLGEECLWTRRSRLRRICDRIGWLER